MACCAMPGGCGRADCYLCTVVAKGLANATWPDYRPADHTERASERKRPVNPTRDGAPKLAAEKSRNPIFEKRRRVGPHR